MRKSFTLIEILISIMIFSFLFLLMSDIINDIKSVFKQLVTKSDKVKQNQLLIKALYSDIVNASSIKIAHSSNANYDRVYLITSNSLYNLINPYVVWYISKNKNTLIRIESPFKIVLPTNNAFFVDKFVSRVKIFKIYQKKNKVLVFIKAKNGFYFKVLK